MKRLTVLVLFAGSACLQPVDAAADASVDAGPRCPNDPRACAEDPADGAAAGECVEVGDGTQCRCRAGFSLGPATGRCRRLPCDATTCASGCCRGAECVPFASQTTAACGANAASCAGCGNLETCRGGACVIPAGAPCGPAMPCGAGECCSISECARVGAVVLGATICGPMAGGGTCNFCGLLPGQTTCNLVSGSCE